MIKHIGPCTHYAWRSPVNKSSLCTRCVYNKHVTSSTTYRASWPSMVFIVARSQHLHEAHRRFDS